MTKTREEFIDEVKSKNQYDLDLTKFIYVNRNTKGIVKCNVCGHEWETLPSVLLGNHGCPICRAKDAHLKRRVPQEEVIRRLTEIYGDKYDLSRVEYINARTKIEIICKKHGSFMGKPHDLFRYHGCPYCQQSRAESLLKNIFEKNNIEFKPQFSFEWMKTSTYGKLSYDFYIPKQNIAIECQGRQHFEIVNAFGGEQEFKKILDRDNNKKQLSENNGVKLIYFLDKRFNKYMKENDIYFNNTDELVKYIKDCKIEIDRGN